MTKDDLISRQAALNAMDTWDKFGCNPDGKLVRYDDDNHYVPYVHYDDMVHVIKHLPSAQSEQKKGEWILKPNIYGVAYCSECDYELHTDNTNYCPNCGADMRGEENG